MGKQVWCGVPGGGAAAYLWTPAGSRRRWGGQRDETRRGEAAGRQAAARRCWWRFSFSPAVTGKESARADTCGSVHGPASCFLTPFLPPGTAEIL